MAQRISASQFSERTDLPDWRVLLNGIESTFRAGSFEAAARFIADIATAAEALDHHPDVDLRYPDRVHIVLTTHVSGGLTDRDVELAQQISSLAAAGDMTSEPTSPQRMEVAIDAMDIDAVRPFWVALLGYKELPPEREGGVVDVIVDPVGIGPGFWFQQMDAPRPQRNRFHIDVTVPHDVADAEGNEACVCTWQDRD